MKKKFDVKAEVAYSLELLRQPQVTVIFALIVIFLLVAALCR